MRASASGVLVSSAQGGEKAGKGERGNVSRKQAFFEKRRKQKERIRRRKLESVGSFSVNLLLYRGDERLGSEGLNCTSISVEEKKPARSDVEVTEKVENDEEERDSISPLCEESCIFISPPSHSECKQQRPITHTSAPIIKPCTPRIAVEGSFLAACSSSDSLTLLKDYYDDCSSNSSSSSTSNMTFGRSWDDGLITIDENASVKMW